ncbi:MAG: HlyD family efflux transporter periplasmic adaptor subunit [Bacteroidota bacterium]
MLPKETNAGTESRLSRSEVVEEIIGTPPNWIARYGNMTILLGLVAMVALGSFYHYPDIVKGELTLTTVNPAYQQVAPGNFLIEKVTVDNLDTVVAGQVMVAFESSARFSHVLSLEDRIKSSPMDTDSALAGIDIPSSLNLGTLQEQVYDFQESQEAYRTAQNRTLNGLSIRELNDRISRELNAIQLERRHQERLQDELIDARANYADDEVLHADNRISRIEYLASRDNVDRIERLIRTTETNIRNHRFELEIMRNQILSLQTGEENQLLLSGTDMRERYNLLLTALDDWKKKYLLLTPIDGVVHFNLEVRENQLMAQGEPVATVVPIQGDGIIGRIDLPLRGSGKIAEGQRVLVKFANYPYLEFGSVEAEILQIAEIPSGGKIQIKVGFPNGLITNTGKSLNATQFMVGSAEIITDEKSLLSWFMERF